MATTVNLFPGGSFTSVSASDVVGEYSLNPGAVDDSAALSALLTAGARKVKLGSGTFTWKSECGINFNGIHIEGNGQEATFIRIDDSGGNIGDAFQVNSVLDFSLKGMTITAVSGRTAGAAIRIVGTNNITATPVEKTQQYVVEDVNFDSQFICIQMNNSGGGAGAWGGHFTRSQITALSANGIGFDVNSPAGGQHYISNVKMYGAAGTVDASRPLAGVRYRGGADLEMVNVNQVYFQNGLLIDPPNGQAANVCVATACLWDNNTQASVKIAPAAGGTVEGVELNGGWGYTPAANLQPCVQITGGTDIKIFGGKYWGNYQAFNVAGPASKVLITGTDTRGSAVGYYFNTNAADFQVIGNTCAIRSVTPTVGIQIDAGCDHYTVTGNNVREATTPITNTPGTSAGRRIVQDNIIA